jgi:4-hydroxy-tetrahydrodipicolinate reductase
MMEAATKIASYMPHAEIIEMHHDQKVDSPSGTALKTAAMMAPYTKDQTIPFSKQPSRGKPVDGIAIHSVRLPGLFAHQMVIFGGEGETLTIRHDSTDRRAMMPGLLLALRKVGQLAHLVYGLEHLLKEK